MSDFKTVFTQTCGSKKPFISIVNSTRSLIAIVAVVVVLHYCIEVPLCIVRRFRKRNVKFQFKIGENSQFSRTSIAGAYIL